MTIAAVRSRRAETANASRRRRREAARAIRDAARAIEIDREIEGARRSLQRREVRVVRVAGRRFALGVLAGTDVLHGFVPDEHTATACRLCFGWCNDFRHWPTRAEGGSGGNRADRGAS